MNEKYESPKGIDLFCESIVNTTYEDLSEDNIRIFKDRLLDMVGCIFGGTIVEENDFLEEQLCLLLTGFACLFRMQQC